MRRITIALALLCALAARTAVYAQCGGDERWALKVGAHAGAAQISLNPITTSLADLVKLVRPTLPNDDVTRTSAEREVRVVDARLVKFKQETGKTGDSDFHLVISDETLLYSEGGASKPVSPHSVIAEIPDPKCIGGRNSTVTGPSQFQSKLVDVRTQFLNQFGTIKSGWNDAGGIPVRLTGVVFFDRAHGQVGRALNGLELHPLLAIEFNPSTSAPGGGSNPPPVAPSVSVINADFEAGASGWTASKDVVSNDPATPAHSGQWKAWLGGYGTPHSDKLWQQVALPQGGNSVALTFYMHVDTDEDSKNAYDKLRIHIRDANGKLLKTIKTYSNLDAASGFSLQSADLAEFRGQTIRIEFASQEDDGSATSFIIDDVRIVTSGA